MNDKDSALTVVKVDRENHDTTSIYFAGPGALRFKDRKPGQFATIRLLKHGKWSKPHPFTLSCPPEDDTLRMTIKRSGEFTSGIPELEPSAPIQCSGPFGEFLTGIDEQRNIVMIVGGVGITPFLSVLCHFATAGADTDILLLWANKTHSDAFAAAELSEMTRTMKLRVVHVLSRVDQAAQQPDPVFDDSRPGNVRYVYGRLDSPMLARLGVGPGAGVYLYGPPAMQTAVLNALAQCGVESTTVRTEAFAFIKSTNPASAAGDNA